MTESTIRTQIYTVLRSVTDIGVVYDYDRWAADWVTFINLFKTTIDGVDQIRGWEISRKAVIEGLLKFDVGSKKKKKKHSFVIRGYLGLKDADGTEKIFNSLIEAVASAFRSNETLNSTAWFHDGLQAEIIEARMFGGVLCHYCEAILTVHETV